MRSRVTIALVLLLAAASALSRRAWAQESSETWSNSVVRWRASISYAEASNSARKWWDEFLKENSYRPALVDRLVQELIVRRANLTDFFLSYVYSDTDNIQANLHFLDYRRNAFRDHETWSYTNAEGSVTLETIRGLAVRAGAELTTDDERRWWLRVEVSHTNDVRWMARILNELIKRDATIRELFLATMNSGSPNAEAALAYMDYARLAPKNTPVNTNKMSPHPYRAWRAPVGKYYATPISGFASDWRGRTAELSPEQENRLWREYVDSLTRADPARNDKEELASLIRGCVEQIEAMLKKEPDETPPLQQMRRLYRTDALVIALRAAGRHEDAIKQATSALNARVSQNTVQIQNARELLHRHLAELQGAKARQREGLNP